MPLISVIIPAYNAEKYLKDSIESILSQTFRDFELIVVDDGSTDSTPSVLDAFSDPRIQYRRLERNSGTAVAVNSGYGAATGEFIANMDADDIAMPGRLELQYHLLTQCRNVTVVGTGMEFFGGQTGVTNIPFTDPQIKACFLPGSANICNPTAMIRRSFLVQNDLFCEPDLKGAFDWGFWVEIMRRGGSFANIKTPLLRYRVHASQQSRDQGDIRPELARVRSRILELFYPDLSVTERTLLEPLLQWVNPPSLSASAVMAGLEVLEKALPYGMQSRAGEDRKVLESFLAACRNRWREALQGSQVKKVAP